MPISSALQQAFIRTAKDDDATGLAAFFQQWLQRGGAPQLAMTGQQRERSPDGQTRLQLNMQQTQADPAFTLQVPLQIRSQEGSVQTETLAMTQKQQTFTLDLPADSVSVALDPDFDVFRLPDAREVPPALNVLFNRSPKAFVLPRIMPQGMELAWAELADTLSWGQADMPVQYDDAALPDDDVVVLLGGDNAMLSDLLERAQQPFKLTETAYTLNSVNYTCGLHSLALTLQAGTQQIILLDASTPQGLDSLMRKLPHYGKYSYALFNSANGENVAKGQWEVQDSPLQIRLQ
ncbi:MAG: hypothetical protein R3E95_22925 [Thiolinea sp.]